MSASALLVIFSRYLSIVMSAQGVLISSGAIQCDLQKYLLPVIELVLFSVVVALFVWSVPHLQ
ncbi:hypothetical protein EMIT0347P_10062 [Pseudomonas sp. IT-347P]